jgi:hypothetical protein
VGIIETFIIIIIITINTKSSLNSYYSTINEPVGAEKNREIGNLNIQGVASNRLYRVSQNSRIPNSEHGREGPSGARKILTKKKFPLPKEDISTLILFNT